MLGGTNVLISACFLEEAGYSDDKELLPTMNWHLKQLNSHHS